MQSSFAAAAAVHFISRPPLFLSSSERASSEYLSVSGGEFHVKIGVAPDRVPPPLTPVRVRPMRCGGEEIKSKKTFHGTMQNFCNIRVVNWLGTT